MQAYDIAMLVVLLGTTFFGFWKGMAWQLASLGSIVLSYFAALNFSNVLAPYIAAEAPWNKFVAMLIIYLVVAAGIWIAFRMVAAAIDRVKLQEFDRQVGAMFGAVKGVLLCLSITFFAVSLSQAARDHIMHTKSGYYAAWALDQAHLIMPEELHAVLGPYIHELDGALPGDYQRQGHQDHDHGAPSTPAQPNSVWPPIPNTASNPGGYSAAPSWPAPANNWPQTQPGNSTTSATPNNQPWPNSPQVIQDLRRVAEQVSPWFETPAQPPRNVR